MASLLVECRQKIQEIGNVASKSGLLLVPQGGREGITKWGEDYQKSLCQHHASKCPLINCCLKKQCHPPKIRMKKIKSHFDFLKNFDCIPVCWPQLPLQQPLRPPCVWTCMGRRDRRETPGQRPATPATATEEHQPAPRDYACQPPDQARAWNEG